MNKVITYLASDVYTKGGIERYSRAQIQAAKELMADHHIRVFSLNPPGKNAFETHFETYYHGKGLSLFQKMEFSLLTLFHILLNQPAILWANHIRLLPLAFLGKVFSPKSSIILNVYGLEMWSGLRMLEKITIRWTKNIISDSHFTAKYVQNQFQISPDHFHVIWDPVDINRFTPKEIYRGPLKKRFQIPDLEDSMCLMTLGRIAVGSRHKGYDRLIDLMHELRDEKIHLMICGDGNDRSRLETRVRDEGLGEKVFFTGSIPEDDLVNIYQLADVFILVSDRGINRGEGVPLTPLEAAACGKPIIVGNEDGSQEAVRSGRNGYIVSPSDLMGIKHRVLELYQNKEHRISMGKQAREVIIEDFSYQVFKEKLELVLRSIS